MEEYMANCEGCRFRGQWCEKENRCPLFKESSESKPEEQKQELI